MNGSAENILLGESDLDIRELFVHPAFDDGVSALVALSGETLAINGELLKRFKLSSLGLSAVSVPVKIHQELIGLLVVVRKAALAFEGTVQSLLKAVAGYASILLVNKHLYRALPEGVDKAQAGEKKKEKQPALQSATYPFDSLLAGKIGKLSTEQEEALETAQSSLKRAVQLSIPNRTSQANGDPKRDNG
jgi:transcriptional regulator with GAF, ATPase, and Fis domain